MRRDDKNMNVFAINSSPKKEKGYTAKILNPFLQGMKEEEAHVDLYYTADLEINPCQACYACWLETPGQCVHDDDMRELTKKFIDANIIVLASPLYWWSLTGSMKNFLDRLFSIGTPYVKIRDGHCYHPPLIEPTGEVKLALVSTCGYWEMDNFDSIINHMESLCKFTYFDYAGALLRPHSTFTAIKNVDDIINAAKEAGRQLVNEGTMSPDLLQIISRELVSLDEHVEFYNKWAKSRLE
jgi:putative NADPH-quinone reductase